jgi:hypothetical protein
MKEIVNINWLLLAAPSLCVLGIALVISMLGLMEYSSVSCNLNRRDFIKKKLFKTGVRISAGLIITGIILFQFKIPSDKLIVVQISKVKPDASIQWLPTGNVLHFAPAELTIDAHNKSHILNNEGMIDNTISLFWDGFIQTPFIRFEKGDYTVEFLAKGTKAEDEFSKIKVEFETPGKDNDLATQSIIYFELTKTMNPYRMNFKTGVETIGRIRLTYFNDIFIPKTGKGRDVWVKEFTIIKH